MLFIIRFQYTAAEKKLLIGVPSTTAQVVLRCNMEKSWESFFFENRIRRRQQIHSFREY